MIIHPIIIERRELYRQVWAKPMNQLAKEYGISDVALAKTCRKGNIPLPGRGYWAKIVAGRKIKPAPLPALPHQASTKIPIGIQKSKYYRNSLPNEMGQQSERGNESGKPIHVPSRLGSLHPILARMRLRLEAARPNDYQALWCPELKAINLRVSKKSLSRALRILNTLYSALEERGYPITYQQREQPKVVVTLLGEQLAFGIEEKFKQIKQDPKELAKLSWWDRSRIQYHPTGLLALKIQEYTGGTLRKLWRDGKRQKIADLLNPFIIGLIQVAEWKKSERMRREREARERMEAERRRKILDQKRLEEEEKIRQFEQEVTNWHRAQQVRAYVTAIKETVDQKVEGNEPNLKVDAWFAWANQYANHLDPLKGS